MTKKEMFAMIKEINTLVDLLKSGSLSTEDYRIMDDSLDGYLELLVDGVMDSRMKCSLHRSNRTDHYYIRFA